MEKGNINPSERQYGHSLNPSRSEPSLRSQYTIIGTGQTDSQMQKLPGVLSLVNTMTDTQSNSSSSSKPLSQSMVNEVRSNYSSTINSQSTPSNYSNSNNDPNRQVLESTSREMPNSYSNSRNAPIRPFSQSIVTTISDSYANSIAPSRPSSQNSFRSQTSYAPSIMERFASDEIPTKENFGFLYEKFIKQYHSNNSCRIPDHINKFNDSPTYQKKTFCTFELFLIVKECGGINKLPRQWTISQPHLHQKEVPRNWTQVAALLGYDTKATNISFRIKEWLRFHHIDSFFDYLMGIPNTFFTGVINDSNGQVDHRQEAPRYLTNSPLTLSPRSINSQGDQLESPSLENTTNDDLLEDHDSFRKRSFEKLKTLARKRSSSLLSSMNTLSVDEKTDLNDLDRDQMVEMISKMGLEIIELKSQCHKYDGHVSARDQRIQILQQELDEKNHLLNRASKFKELILRNMELL